MIIDKKRLDEIEAAAGPDPSHIILMARVEVRKLVRLARLGLEVERKRPYIMRNGVPEPMPTPREIALAEWAEERGIKAVKQGLENTNSEFCGHTSHTQCSWCEPFENALAALPKETQPDFGVTVDNPVPIYRGFNVEKIDLPPMPPELSAYRYFAPMLDSKLAPDQWQLRDPVTGKVLYDSRDPK